MEWKYRTSKVVQDMVVYANNRRIDFKTYVDFHEQHQLLKAAFPVDIRSTYATYDVQYGNVKRPNHWNTSWDQARFESVAHRYVDLAERNYGVSLLNDCKYGHDVKEHVMRITLLKSATHPDYAQDQGGLYVNSWGGLFLQSAPFLYFEDFFITSSLILIFRHDKKTSALHLIFFLYFLVTNEKNSLSKFFKVF